MTPITIEQAIQLALEHHRAGRLAEAEALYRQVLSEVPGTRRRSISWASLPVRAAGFRRRST